MTVFPILFLLCLPFYLDPLSPLYPIFIQFFYCLSVFSFLFLFLCSVFLFFSSIVLFYLIFLFSSIYFFSCRSHLFSSFYLVYRCFSPMCDSFSLSFFLLPFYLLCFPFSCFSCPPIILFVTFSNAYSFFLLFFMFFIWHPFLTVSICILCASHILLFVSLSVYLCRRGAAYALRVRGQRTGAGL
jgi:hypothetical protein